MKRLQCSAINQWQVRLQALYKFQGTPLWAFSAFKLALFRATHNFQKKHAHVIFGIECSLRDDNVITSKPTWKLKRTNSIIENFEYFCQMSSKLILIILSYTISKLFWDTVWFQSECIEWCLMDTLMSSVDVECGKLELNTLLMALSTVMWCHLVVMWCWWWQMSDCLYCTL